MGKANKTPRKAPLSFLPPEALVLVAYAMASGARPGRPKDGWKTKRYSLEAVLEKVERHILARRMGMVLDSETGESHLAHAAADLLIALWYEITDFADQPGGLTYDDVLRPRH